MKNLCSIRVLSVAKNSGALYAGGGFWFCQIVKEQTFHEYIRMRGAQWDVGSTFGACE